MEEQRQKLEERYGPGLFLVIPADRFEVRRLDQPPLPGEAPIWMEQLLGSLRDLVDAVDRLADRLDRPTPAGSSPTGPQS